MKSRMQGSINEMHALRRIRSRAGKLDIMYMSAYVVAFRIGPVATTWTHDMRNAVTLASKEIDDIRSRCPNFPAIGNRVDLYETVALNEIRGILKGRTFGF